MALAAWLPLPMEETLPEPDAMLSKAELKLLKKSELNCSCTQTVSQLILHTTRQSALKMLLCLHGTLYLLLAVGVTLLHGRSDSQLRRHSVMKLHKCFYQQCLSAQEAV